MLSKRKDCEHVMRVKKNLENLNATDLSLLEKKHCYKLMYLLQKALEQIFKNIRTTGNVHFLLLW